MMFTKARASIVNAMNSSSSGQRRLRRQRSSCSSCKSHASALNENSRSATTNYVNYAKKKKLSSGMYLQRRRRGTAAIEISSKAAKRGSVDDEDYADDDYSEDEDDERVEKATSPTATVKKERRNGADVKSTSGNDGEEFKMDAEKNGKIFRTKAGKASYGIARKDGKEVDTNAKDFLKFKKRAETKFDVIAFVAQNNKWEDINEARKIREFRQREGYELFTDLEADAVYENLDLDQETPEFLDHLKFLDEQGNITGRALFVCITSFWMRLYYNLAQFDLNKAELLDITNRALVPKEKVSEWFTFATQNYNRLNTLEKKEYYDAEIVKLLKFEKLVEDDFNECVRLGENWRLDRYYGENESFVAVDGFGMTQLDVDNDPVYRAFTKFLELTKNEQKEEEERKRKEEEEKLLDRSKLERIFQDGSNEHPFLLDGKKLETSGSWKTLETDFDRKEAILKTEIEAPILDDADDGEWIIDGGWDVLPDHTAVDARDGSALKFVGVKHALDPETGKVTSDWNEAYDSATWMYERPANATKFPILEPMDQIDLRNLNENKMPSIEKMEKYMTAKSIAAGDGRNARRRVGDPTRKMLTRLENGETLKAVVKSLDLYHGALVDCGTEIDGLVPIAEADMPRARVFLAVGTELDVKVSRVHAKWWRIRFPLEVMPLDQNILNELKNGHPHDYNYPPINIYQGQSDEFAFLDAGRDIRSDEAIAAVNKRKEEQSEKRRLIKEKEKESMKRYEKATTRAKLAAAAKLKNNKDLIQEDNDELSDEDIEIAEAHDLSSKLRRQFEDEEEAALNKSDGMQIGAIDSTRISDKPRSSRQDEEDAEEGITPNRAAEDVELAKLKEGKAFVDPDADDLRGGVFGVDDTWVDDDNFDDDDDDRETLRKPTNNVLGINVDDDDDEVDGDDDDVVDDGQFLITDDDGDDA
jgi:hypothetical protein